VASRRDGTQEMSVDDFHALLTLARSHSFICSFIQSIIHVFVCLLIHSFTTLLFDLLYFWKFFYSRTKKCFFTFT